MTNKVLQFGSMLMDHDDQKVTRERFPKEIYAIGFSFWKKRLLKHFLHGAKLHFVNSRNKVPENATIAFWGNIPPENCSKHQKILRVEDGFLRSVGLGAVLVDPLSWVIDSLGLYYDASKPSEIEHILQNNNFDKALLNRAQYLLEKIVTAGLTKYNLKGSNWKKPDTKKTIILVPGQVESDASIQFGSPHIKTNFDLLKAVRKGNSDAYIVYKPHPDVVTGLRPEGATEDQTHTLCDEVAPKGDVISMLAQVDEVHIMTSLLGFEALLRNKPVTCYGQPFYAGWGLTRDIFQMPRRTRKLTLDELVAGALILYPLYIHPKKKMYITPEQSIDYLLLQRKNVKKRTLVFHGIVRYYILFENFIKDFVRNK